MHTSHGEPAPPSQGSDTPEPYTVNPLTLPERIDPETDPSLPADLRSPLQILDLAVLLIFYFITGTAISVAVQAVAHYMFGVSSADLENSTSAKSLVILLSQSLLSGATLIFLYAMVRSRSAEPFWPAVGWRRFRGARPALASAMKFLFAGFLLALLSGWASGFFDQNLLLPMEELLRSRQSALLLMALGVLVAPAVEETIFRGCIYPILARKLGVAASVLTTGLLFGLAHAPQLWPGYGEIGLLIVVGIVLTFIRARTGTVAASYFVHLGYNILLFGGFLLSTSGLRHLPS